MSKLTSLAVLVLTVLLTPSAAAATIAAGYQHTCAVTATGGAKCWGYDNHGELGQNSRAGVNGVYSITPVDVSGLTSGVAAIAAGNIYSCALTTAGGVKCWGDNYTGQLGDNSTTERRAPVDVSGLTSGAAAIAVGNLHSCALTTAGGVKCWGYNSSGQLGDNTTTDRHTPVDVSGLTSGVAAITVGYEHSCALTTAGGIKCWGDNSSGLLGDNTYTNRHTPVDVSGLTSGVAAISAGPYGTCALTTAGGVKCWGSNGSSQLDYVSGLASGVAAIAAGTSHTCALTASGSVKCWGYNPSGQLGDSSTTNRTTPVDVSGLTSGMSAISAGDAHTCALTTAGGVKCWGNGSGGRLGDNTQTIHLTPVDVIGISVATSATATTTTTTSTTTTTVASRDTTSPTVPTGLTANVIGATQINLSWTASIDAVGVTAYKVYRGGVLVSSLGNVTTYSDTGLTASTPYSYTVAACDTAGNCSPQSYSASGTTQQNVTTGASNGIVAIAAGVGHYCALTAAGGVKCWGDNYCGELGDNTTTQRRTPVDVSGLSSGVAAIEASHCHTCALTTAGGVKCWGLNSYGQLGDSTTTERHTPVDVAGLTSGVAAISAGKEYTCALTTAGAMKCWGANYTSQLGDNTTTPRHTPVDVSGLTSGVAAIAAGDEHTCALTTAGGVKCWGYNGAGQLGDNTYTERHIPVDVAGLTSGVAAITAGRDTTCALTKAGGVKCLGGNSYGQLGDNTTTDRHTAVDVSGLTSGVAAISTGYLHTCALTQGGGVKCWGNNYHGQLGDNTITDSHTPVDVFGLTSGMAAIAVGSGQHTCALTTAGGVKCWGYNGEGELGDDTTTDRHIPVDVIGLSAVTSATGTTTTTSLLSLGAWKVYGTSSLQGSILTIGDNVGYDTGDADKDGNPYNVWYAGSVSGQTGGDYDEALSVQEFSPPLKLSWTGCFPETSQGYNNIIVGRKNTAFSGSANSQQYLITQEFGYQTRWDKTGLNTTVLSNGAFDIQQVTGATASSSGYCADYRIEWADNLLKFYYNGTKVREQSYTYVGPVSVVVRSFDKPHTMTAISMETGTTTTTSATSANSKSDCLFNWAESSYGFLFSPKGSSVSLGPYYFRHYSETNAYLVVTSNSLFYLGPLSDNQPIDIGSVSTWYATAGCN